MMFVAIFVLVIASVLWTIFELSLNTFKAPGRSKTCVIGFTILGAVVAAGVSAVPLIVNHGMAYGGQVSLVSLPLCPSSVAFIVFLDIRHPRLSSLEEGAIFTVVVNAALYAAIGGRVGEFLRKKRAAA